MKKKRRVFNRSSRTLPVRKKYVISIEGKVTERQYFSLFQKSDSLIDIRCLESTKGSSPHHVLKRMQKYLQNNDFRKNDQAWVVVDKDAWTDQQLEMLFQWSQNNNKKYGFALSNPMFEFWLLLHFEDGKNVRSIRNCKDKLKNHLADYNKKIPRGKITKQNVQKAIERAKRRDTPKCPKWPTKVGCTTVYRLVENIVEHFPE